MVIDTNIFIEHLRAKDKKTTSLSGIKVIRTAHISAITLFELYAGANNRDKIKDVKLLTDGISILDFSAEIAQKSATIFQSLKRKNKLIDYRDIFIASTCLYHNLPLLTHNKKDFSRISDLKLIVF